MRKRFLSMILTLVMVIGVLPAGMMAVSATTYTTWIEAGKAAVANADYKWTDENTLAIYSAKGLAWFANESNGTNGTTTSPDNFSSKTVKLMNNIDLSGVVDETNLNHINSWKPISAVNSGYFKGVFDGNGYTISNMKIKYGDASNNSEEWKSGQMAGLFDGISNGAVIRNLGVVNSQIVNTGSNNPSYSVGGIVGYAFGGSKIINCFSNTNISSESGFSLGGIVGYTESNARVFNCYNLGNVTGNTSGGIVGSNSGIVKNVYSVGNISGMNSGAVVGENYINNDYPQYNATLENAYYKTGSASGGIGTGNLTGATAKSDSEMKSADIVSLLNMNASSLDSGDSTLKLTQWQRSLDYPTFVQLNYTAAITVNKNGAVWGEDAAQADIVLSKSSTDVTAGKVTGTPTNGVFAFTGLSTASNYYVWAKNSAGTYVNVGSVSSSSTAATADYYDVTLTKGTGIESVSGGGTYLKNETATISAVLNDSGYEWSKWNDTYKTQTNQAITVTAKTDLTAQATPIPATAPTVSTTGTTLTYGYTSGSISATATPDTGHTTTGYQWYESDSSGTKGTAVNGATSATYTIPTGKNAGEYYYVCDVTVTRGDNSQSKTVTTTPATKVTVNKINPTTSVLTSALPTNAVFNGNAQGATVSAKTGVTGLGAITVYYQTKNSDGTYNAKTTTVPKNVGTYKVIATTLDGTNYNGYDVDLGDYSISKKTPVKDDYTFSLTARNYTGSPSNVSVTGKLEGMGKIKVYYEGVSPTSYAKSETAPTVPGTYTVTIDVADGANYKDTTDLNIGNFTINKATPTVTISSSKNPSIYEDELTFTATVSFANGVTPTGKISFVTQKGQSVFFDLDNGVSTYKISSLDISNASNISAQYVGNEIYNLATGNYTQAISQKPISFTIEDTEFFYESGIERNITIKDTGTKLTANNFNVKYYLVDENSGKLASNDAVIKAISAGKYLYVIDFEDTQSNYQIAKKFSVTDTALPDVSKFDNVGYMDIKSSGAGQQKPISFANGTASVFVTDGTYTNNLTNENASTITYKSSNEELATVEPDGTVAIKKAGTVTITATSNMQNTTPVYASYVLTINKKPVTITAKDDSVEFGTAWDKSTTVSYSDGLAVANFTGTLDFDTKYAVGSKVGEYEIMPKGLTSDKYAITFIPAILTVTPKTLDLSNFSVTAKDKTYDETTGVSISASVNSGIYSGNVVKPEIEGSFTSANASEAATVSYTITGLTGKDADNYVLASNMSGSKTAKISKATVSVICPANTTKTFDATAQSVDISAMANGAVFDSSNYSVKYNNSDSATNVGVYTISIELKDSVKNNYTVNPFVASLSIKAATQDVFSIENIPNAVYYGDTFTAVAEGGQSGNISYSVTGNATINPSTGDVTVTGTGKITVTATKTITGYATRSASRSFTAMPKVITPISNLVDSITYNGNTNADVSISFANGEIVGSDNVVATAVATRIDTNAGTDKLVYVKNIALSGANAANYVLSTTTLQDSINVTPIEVTSFTIVPQNKVYDGTNKAESKVTAINGVLSTDLKDVTIIGSAAFDKADTTATKVTYTIDSVTGLKASNYNFKNTTSEASASISKAKVNFSAGSASFVYDGKQKNVEITALNGNSKFTDFTVSYDNKVEIPSNVGTYSVNVSLNDSQNYETDFAPFGMEILSADQAKLIISGMPGTLEYSKKFKLSATGGSYAGGTISWTSSNESIATVDNLGNVNLVGVGSEVTLTATKSGGDNFNDEVATVTFTPVSKQASFKITKFNNIYDGNAKPVTVVPSDLNMAENTDYTVIYYDEKNQKMENAPTNAGTYYAEVATANDKYTANANATITIKKAAVSGVTVEQADGVYKTALADAVVSGTVPFGVTSKIAYLGNGIVTQQAEKPTKAGTYTVVLTLSGDNYETYTATNTFKIAPKTLTVSDFNVKANDKVYDESINAVLSCSTTGTTDDVKAEVIGSFTSADASETANVNYTITSLTGKDADNYVLDKSNASGSTNSIISKATVNVICASTTTRTFDQNAQKVDVSAMSNGNVFDSSNYTVKYDGADSATAVGTYPITIVLSSEAAKNYTVADFTASLVIKEAAQDVFSIEGTPDRVYYGDNFNVSTQGANGDVTYILNNGAPATIENGNITATGTGLVTITATSTKEGYTDKTATKTFTVYPRVITPTASATDRVYNTQNGVEVTIDLENVMLSDSISATASGTMANADAGTNKMVYVSGISLDGANKSFYTLSASNLQTTVNIEEAYITGFEILADGKKYDGTNAASAKVTDISGIFDADKGQIGLTGSAMFDDETSNTSKTVTFTATDITGAKATNYKFADDNAKTATATADITPINVKFNIGTTTFKYDEEKKEVAVSGVDELGRIFDGFTVEYCQADTKLDEAPTEAGDYTVKIVLSDNANYTTAQTDIPMTIAKIGQEQIAIVGLPSTIEYTDSFTLEAIGGSGTGEVLWTSDNENVTVDNNGLVSINGAVGETVTITATKKDDTNFTGKTAKVVFKPTAKTVSFTLSDLEQTYNENDKEVAVTLNVTDATYDVTYNGKAELPINVGTYNVLVKATGNYQGIANATMTINKAAMTGLYINQNGCTYGDTLEDASYDTAPNGVDVSVKYSTFDGNKPTKAGKYTVTATYTGANFETYVTSTELAIAKKVLTVKADDKTRKFGEANPVFTLSYDGFVGTENIKNLLLEPVATTIANASSPVNAEGYEITVTGGRSDNYEFNYENTGKLKVTGAVGGYFYITGANNSVTVGDMFALHAYYDNAQPEVKWESSDSRVATVDENGNVKVLKMGETTITATVTDTNYESGISATFKLNTSKKSLSLKAEDLVKVYNAEWQDIKLVSEDANFVPTLSGDNKNIDITYTLTTDSSVTQPKQVGTYTVTYTINHPSYSGGATVTMYINKATATVTAHDLTKVYGEGNPSYYITGLIGNDELSADYIAKISDMFTISSDADAANAKTNVGKYPITLTVKEGKTLNDDLNYNLIISDVKGKLTVTKALLNIKVSDASRAYSMENVNPVYEYAGFVNSETDADLTAKPVFTYDTNITKDTNIGAYPDVITASGADSGNYEISYSYTDGSKANITVTPLPVTLSSGTSRSSYLTVNLNKAIPGLTKDNFTVTLDGTNVDITNVIANSTNTAYTLNGSFKTGSTYSVTMTANPNYTINGSPISITPRSSGGSSGGGGGSVTTTTYTITVTQGVNGKISPDTVKVEKNESKTFTITADEGYEIEDVLVNGKSAGEVSEYTFEKITSAGTITAKFKKVAPEKPVDPVDPTQTEWKNPFGDVNTNDWFYNAVKFVNENKLMSGTQTDEFAPNAEITRAMFVTVLYRMENEPNANTSMFDDLENGAYYEKAVAWASENGIVKGISDTEFAPNNSITREQMAAIAYRYAKFKGIDTSVSGKTNYADNASVSDYANDAVVWASNNSIMSGNTDGTFAPQNNSTRAEAAMVFMKILTNLK